MISLDGKHDVRRGVPVVILLHFDGVCELGYSCGVAMFGGTIEGAS